MMASGPVQVSEIDVREGHGRNLARPASDDFEPAEWSSSLMATPRHEVIPSVRYETEPDGADPPAEPPSGPIDWEEVTDLLAAGEATTWLSLSSERGVHTRPVFGAWTGRSFIVASNPEAVKTRHLDAAALCSVALDLGKAHLVVEVEPHRLTSIGDLERAVRAFEDVYDWPTTVQGDLLDAPYAAPTSGGPPFRVYELTPVRAHAFPTDDSFEPTRFIFG